MERIENGREIPGLRDSLVQIMQDYRLQVSFFSSIFCMHSIYIKYMKPWLDIERERESNHKKELLLGSQKSKPHKLQTLCIPMNNRILDGFQIKLSAISCLYFFR